MNARVWSSQVSIAQGVFAGQFPLSPGAFGQPGHTNQSTPLASPPSGISPVYGKPGLYVGTWYGEGLPCYHSHFTRKTKRVDGRRTTVFEFGALNSDLFIRSVYRGIPA